MAFQIIQNDAGTPAEVEEAIALLNQYGYGIVASPTGKLVVALEGTDIALLNFFKKYVKTDAGSYIRSPGIKVNFFDLHLLALIADQVAAARNNRDLRHALVNKYFGTTTSHDLYRNLAGFAKAFDHFDVNASYTVRLV